MGTPATTNLRCLPPEPNHLPVLAFKATPSSLGSGTHLPAHRLSALNQQQSHMSHTTQSRSTLATVLRLVITAVVVVIATKVLESANVSRVSQGLPARRLLISFKFVCIRF